MAVRPSTSFDSDTYRSAHTLIERYGDDARILAVIRTAERIGAGDHDGQFVWKRIVCAIDELLSSKRPDGVMVH